MKPSEENKDLVFEGESENFSFEEALKDAISKDPKDTPGTDLFKYTVLETNCQFGGFVQSFKLSVKIRRQID
jgi:hypothetical protein